MKMVNRKRNKHYPSLPLFCYQKRPAVKSQIPTILLMAICGALVSQPAAAQETDAMEGRLIPGCGTTVCEEETQWITALDTLLRSNPECSEIAPAVLRTVHITPYTGFADAAIGRRTTHLIIPASPPVMHVDDVLPRPFLRYWNEIEVIDAEQIHRGELGRRCLYVFSPVLWLGERLVRVSVAEAREEPFQVRSLKYVFLQKQGTRWKVVRVEVGIQ
jgi:hypothetical protein